jgi:tRNA A-37 threonylcarbamoyl transferase component Bud32
MEDLQYSLESARNTSGQAVYLMWVVKGEVRVLSIVCGLAQGSDDAVWVLRSGEKIDSPILWRHLTSDAQLIHMCISQEMEEEGVPAAVIPEFLRPHASRAVAQLVGDGNGAGPAVASEDEHTVVEPTELEPPGTVLGNRWEIIEEIGNGAMGVVYKAKQLSIDRFVALKILHNHLVTKEINKKRFETEAKATSTLAHQNLIHIYDFGTSPGGRPYIVMDFVEGPTLLDVLQHEGCLDLPSMAEIFIQICRGLNHAHRKGIVHRDLKPSNIKLAEGDLNSVVVKILDFGIAKILKDDEQQLTRAGDIIGSPLYMSPEQCKGEALDARSDIYSLGCMMYQTITGALPFVGKDPFETMYKHIYEKAPAFETIRPDLLIPADLQRIIFKMLSIPAGDRYARIDEVEAELMRLRASGQEISAVGQDQEEAAPVANMEVAGAQTAINVQSLLRQSGAVAQVDIDQVMKLTAEVGGDVGKILVATGKVDPLVHDAAVKCKKLIDKNYCNLSQAVILLGFCLRKQVSFEDGSRELGWEFGDL